MSTETKVDDFLNLSTNEKQELVKSETVQLDDTKVKEISTQLKLNDRLSIHEFGSNVQNKMEEISNEILESSKEQDVTEVQTTINSILKKFNDIDPKVLLEQDEPENKLVKWFRKKLNKYQEKLGLIESNMTAIDKLGEQLRLQKSELLSNATTLDEMSKEAIVLDEALSYYIEAANYKINELKTNDLKALEARVQDNDLKAAQDIQDLKDTIAAIENRKYDLELTRSVILKSRVELRMMSGLNYNLADKIYSISKTNIPLWRSNFAEAITLVRTASANRTIQKVQEGTNQMILQNAENTSKNIIEGTKAMNTSIVDVDTLIKSQNIIMDGLDESNKLVQEYETKKSKNRERLEQFRSNTIERLNNTNI